MKKSKLLICSIASILALGTLGTSIALFVDKSNDLNIDISGSTSADGTLKLESTTAGEQTLNPDKNFTIGYKLINEVNTTTYTQDTSVGDLQITITVANSEDPNVISNALKNITMTGSIQGYVEGSFPAQYNTLNFIEVTEEESGLVTALTCEYLNLGFKNDGTQSIEFTFDAIDDTDTFIANVAGIQFKYDVSLTAQASTEENYYVVGGFDLNWNVSDKYKFVPHIDGTDLDNKEFVYKGLELNPGDELKLKKGDNGEEWLTANLDGSSKDFTTGGNGNIVYNGTETGTFDLYYKPGEINNLYIGAHA